MTAVCPYCHCADCAGEDWHSSAARRRMKPLADDQLAERVRVALEFGLPMRQAEDQDQPLPDCTCGHSLAAHSRNGGRCLVHGCECTAWQFSPDDAGGSDY